MSHPLTALVMLLKVWLSPKQVEYQPGERLRLPYDTAAELVKAEKAESITTTCVRFVRHGTDNLKRAYDPGALANIPQDYANRLLAEKPFPSVVQVTESELIAWETEQAKLAQAAAKAEAEAAEATPAKKK